jgi:hypothetical protein
MKLPETLFAFGQQRTHDKEIDMTTISSSSNVPAFDSNYNGSDGGCTPGPFPAPRKPIPLPIHDGVEQYAAHSGGTIKCPEGTTPSVGSANGGQTVVVNCDEPLHIERLED